MPMAQTAKVTRAAADKAIPPTASAPIVYEEPPEEVLRDFMFIQYAALEAGGGFPATVTATGKSGVLRSKLYSVAKDNCRLSPAGQPGMFECSVNLMGTLWWDGQREPTKPLSDAKRILVIKDPGGKWIDCSYNSEKNKACRWR